MSIVVKIRLGDDLRRLSFERVPLYAELAALISQLFPSLGAYSVKYVDSDEDNITISSDAEVIEALEFARTSGQPLRLVVVEKPAASNATKSAPPPAAASAAPPPPQFPFDLASLQAFLGQFSGADAATPDLASLFQSLGLNNGNPNGASSSASAPQQPPVDFAALLPLIQQVLSTPWIRDLAMNACQQGPHGPHPFGHHHGGRWGGRHHRFPEGSACQPNPACASSSPSSSNNNSGPAVHNGIVCDGCDASPIVGDRYKCSVCDDYDLCSTCEAKKVHDASHPLVKFVVPRVHHGHHAWRRFGHHFGNSGRDFANFGRLGHFSPYGPFAASQGQQDPAGAPFGGRGCPYFRRGCQQQPKFSAKYLQDVTVVDGSHVAPGAKFVKIWKLKNEGQAWPEQVALAFVGGDQLGSPESIPVPSLKEGDEVDVAVDMVAPETPGRYTSYWRMVGPDGSKFGQRVWVDFFVTAETSAPAPAPSPAFPSGEMEVDLSDVSAPSTLPPPLVPTPVQPTPVVPAAPVPAPVAETADEAQALAVLREMGFQHQDLLAVLRRNRGQLLAAIRELCG